MEETVNVVVVLTTVVTVIIALITALTSARRSAFEELKQVVDTLQRSLDDEKKLRAQLEDAFIQERNERLRIENWARKLVRQLQIANIVPAEIDK